MFRQFSRAALLLVLAAPALAAPPPRSDDQRAANGDEARQLTEGETYGVVTQVDRTMNTITVRKLGGEIATYDYGTMNLDEEVNVGSTVRIAHEPDAMTANEVEPVDLMHDVGVVTKIDEEKQTISIRQLGGEVVEYEYAGRTFDRDRVKVGERVDITHAPDQKEVLFVDIADRGLDQGLPERTTPDQPTDEPTDEPTEQPTEEPTEEPTEQPTPTEPPPTERPPTEPPPTEPPPTEPTPPS